MSRQLVTFRVADHIMAIDIGLISELRAWLPVTPLPNVPPYILGVVNLRGVVLPVWDLQQRLGWGATVPGPRHVIIVVRFGRRLQGIIVDAVDDIVTVDDHTLQPVPDISDTRAIAAADFLEGLIDDGDRLILLLALGRLDDTVDLLADAA